MGTNITGIGNANAIGFKSRVTGGIYFPPELKDALVGVWSAYGKSNDSTDRNIIKNKIKDRGGDFVISNAAFKLNSGFGEYEEDFTSWIQTNGVIASSDKVQNSITGRFLYFNTVNKKEDVPSFKVNITLGQQSKLQYNYIKEDGTSTYIVYSESGIYTIPASYFSKYTGGNAWFGFYQIEGTSTIEQIPSFEGAFVTDGIDDLITSTKTVQEMLGGSTEFTAVSMIHLISPGQDVGGVAYTNYIRTSDNYWTTNRVSNTDKTGIYGYSFKQGTPTVINNVLGDKNDYTTEKSNITSDGSVSDLFRANFSVEGFEHVINGAVHASSVAWYWTIIANKVLTTDQINQVIAYFNLDRTLKPDMLCNITKQGITNDNHADFNDKLIDYSGNGRDIQMNNLAWKGGSGIAAKPFETIKDYTIVSDEARQKLTIYNEFSYKVKSNTPNHYWTVQSIIKDNTSYQVTIITDKDCYWINSTSFTNNEGNKESIRKEYPVKANTPTQVTICGSDQFEYPEGIEAISAVSYVNLEYAGEITVTFIPSHKGGLLLDGVNDFGKVTGMPIYKDYTIVVDYERISGREEALISKAYIVNQGAFVLMETSGTAKHSYSFGAYTAFNRDDFTRTLLYQSKYKCGDVNLTIGKGIDGDTLWLGTLRNNDYRFFNGAIYSLMSFPYSMSEFLIERQLKKHKLGTLYPNMVEFRPVINSNVLLDSKPTFVIRGTSTYLNAGDYVPENSQIWVSIKMNNIADRITKFTVNGKTINIPENAYSEVTLQYGFPFVIDKSPQKIGIIIEQDENYVLFNPVINSNVEYHKLDFYLNNYQKKINIGDYIPKGAYLRANFYLKNNVDELTVFTFNGVNIGYRKNSVDDTAFNIAHIYNYDSPQEVNITIDEYIRFEDIVQPYPVLLRFKDENGNEVSWGGKFKVGSTITRIGSIADPESNLLNGLYSISGLSLNGKGVTSSTSIVEKQMVFKTIATYLLDNNEPKCILSPRLLRIPNSSYKILGYIPDISGHGNHGKINNSAYAEGSGVNEDGSYQFDGVDDFVTIPTIVGGKQVLMKVNSRKSDCYLYDQRNNWTQYLGIVSTKDFIAYNYSNQRGKTYIDGILNENITANDLIGITHNITVTNNRDDVKQYSPCIGTSFARNSYAQMALYDFMLFDDISTEDKIKELNEYVGIEAKVELPPYYWDAYGKTNLDADKATIQQRGVAVGDYDLTNHNHAYEGMSGYNGYPVVFGANKTWDQMPTGTFTWNIEDNKLHITKALIAGNGLLFSYVKLNGSLLNVKEIPSFKIKVSGLEGKSKLWYRYLKTEDAISETIAVLENGIHELPKSYTPSDSLHDGVWVGFTVSPISEGVKEFDCDITIEVLPEYENGLVYDGVDDYSKNENIPVLTDYTYIYKRTIINIPTNATTLLKGADKTNGGAFIADYGNKWQFNFGQYNTIQGIADGINWQTVNSFNGTSINKGKNTDDSGITVAKFSNGYTSMVFYKLILYPKTISLLEINFLKNLMEKDEIIDLNNPIFIKNE